ncbi:MAG: amidohydrolase family protein [Muricoprocola sp.]
MYGECHAHLFMDGINYRKAVETHREHPNEAVIREHLKAYQDAGVTYIREGGDKYGVSVLAKDLAPEYGIEYCSPVFAIHKKGHYGGIVGKGVESFQEFRDLIWKVKQYHGDFIKIMVSGIMDYTGFRKLSEEALEKEWIGEMIHIAHEEGFAVMVHANGREAVLPAVLAGADSIEHGNYIDEECLDAMADKGCIWVPTIVTTKNLIGCGRYEDEILKQIYESECENLYQAYEKGVCIAAGSDAGAYMVPHGRGVIQEQNIFYEVLGHTREVEERMLRGLEEVKKRFRPAK